jgi:PAS domain S-box-containing protein
MVARGIRIAVIGENKALTRTFQEKLPAEIVNPEIVFLKDLTSLFDYLETNSPHLLLLHLSHASDQLLTALQHKKAFLNRLPVILISPPLGEQLALAFIRAGVSDIVPEEGLEELPAAIMRVLQDSAGQAGLLQAEQGLLNYQQLQNLLRMTPVGVFRCDADKKCVYVNDRFCQITGLRPEEAMGDGWHSAIYHEDRHAVLSDWSAKKRIREEIKGIYRYQRPASGEIAWVIGQSISETDRSGNVVGYLGSVTDITRLKKIEEALQEKNDVLVKINQELDNFVYSASHNLRAPLTSMMGLINLIRMEPQNTEVLIRICSMMEHSLGRLDGFIRDILDHSRNARLSVQAVEVKLDEFIQQVLEEFSLQEGFSEIDLKVSLCQEIPFYTDPVRLRIVLRNLISNCIRYKNLVENPSIKIEGEIGLAQSVLRIVDNGTGIRPEHHQKVFEMFYRADERRSGSGLGLYIAREMVEKMGGSIQLSSTSGKGTTVVLQLPNQKAVVQAPPSES